LFSRIARLSLLRLASLFGSLLVALALIAIGLVLFPPVEQLRRAAVVQLRSHFGLAGFDLGQLRLRLQRTGMLELDRIEVGAPAGYDLPLLSAAGVRLHYDLTQLHRKKLKIERLELVQPVLRVEQRQGKPNWQALLEQLGPPSSPGAREETATDAATDPAEASDLEIEVQGIAVEGLSAFVDQGRERVVFDSVSVQGQLHHGPAGTRGKLTLAVSPRGDRRASLALRTSAPEPVEAQLDTRLRLDLELSGLAPLAVETQIALDVTTRRLRARFDLPPPSIALRAAARYDAQTGGAQLNRLSLRFNERELVQLTGRVDQATSDSAHLAVDLRELALPLDVLAPYIRVFVPQLRCGGVVRVADLTVDGAVAELGQQLPAALRGRIAIDDVWAELRGSTAERADISLRGLSGSIRFGAGLSTARPLPPLALLKALPRDLDAATLEMAVATLPGARATLDLALGSVRAAGARLGGLKLAGVLATELDRLDPQSAAFRLQLSAPRIRYRDAALGRVRSSLRLEASGHAAPGPGDATLQRARLVIGRKVRFDARASLEQLGERSLRAHVALAPLQVSTLLAQLPPALRAQLPLRSAAGKLGFRLSVVGRKPRPGTPLLRLPLRIDSRLELSDGRFDQLTAPGEETVALRARGVQAELVLSGRPAALRLAAELHAERLAHVPAGLALRRLAVPVELEARPSGVQGEFGLSIGRVAQRAGGTSLRQNDLALEGRLHASVPLQRLITSGAADLGPAKVEVDGRIGSVRLRQLGLGAELDGVDASLRLTHQPSDASPLRWALDLGVAQLRERIAGLQASGSKLALKGELAGVAARLPEVAVDLDAVAGLTAIDASIARVQHASLVRDLEGVAFDMAVRLLPGGPLDLRSFQLRAPTYGMRLAATARLLEPWRDLARTGLPTFEASVDLGLDNPKAKESAKATVLTKEARAAGKLGLSLSLRNLNRQTAMLRGRFEADDFYLWFAGEPRPAAGDRASRRWRRSLLALRNLNAKVPLSQRLQLSTEPFSLTIPEPKHSIVQADTGGATYQLVRPFHQPPGESHTRRCVVDRPAARGKAGASTRWVAARACRWPLGVRPRLFR
jgi:hypothetical protein